MFTFALKIHVERERKRALARRKCQPNANANDERTRWTFGSDMRILHFRNSG